MKVAVVMGSISDKEVADKSVEILKKFGVDVEMRVISAHRTPYEALDFAKKAEEDGIEVIIAIAGKAAHLAGVIACYNSPTSYWAAYKIINYGWYGFSTIHSSDAKGVPVATVAINGGKMQDY